MVMPIFCTGSSPVTGTTSAVLEKSGIADFLLHCNGLLVFEYETEFIMRGQKFADGNRNCR